MKELLIKLTHTLQTQDIHKDEKELIEEWLSHKYLTKKDNSYKFHSKYRAGTLGVMQNETAYVHVVGERMRDLFIEGSNLNGAKSGDLVIAKRLLGKSGKPSAKIVAIVGHELSYSVAYLIVKEGVKLLVDLKTQFPLAQALSPQQEEEFQRGDLFKIDNANGEILEKLGNMRDPLVDEKIVLAQFNKHTEFEEEVLKIARSFKAVKAQEHPKRKDLRDLAFCTIDPVSAKDFDDAIYWDEENSTLYVAIADVSAYIEPFGALDHEAMYRSFSIYLPHKSIPMLPRELSETLCSLQANVDRLAFVVEMKIDKESLEVQKSSIYEAIIHSQRRFNYQEIDDFFSDINKPQNESENSIINYLQKLQVLTNALKKKRLIDGYDFRSSEINLELDAQTNIVASSSSEETPSHALIEDCMLLANKEAALCFTHGVFRIHEEPSQGKIQSLYEDLAGVGLQIEIKSTIKETLEGIQKEAKRMDMQEDVDTLIIRAQMQARYSSVNHGHFGLGFEHYTHFTSPIRRYSDLIVHRLIKAINAKDTLESSYVLRNIEALTIIISEKEREVKKIEIEYLARKFVRWASENLHKKFYAKVISTDVEYKARLDDSLQGAIFHITNAGNQVLFQRVLVEIQKIDLARAKIYVCVVEE